MSKPTEHKTVQARNLAYAEAEGRDIWNWRLDIGERRGDFNSASLSSLRSLRLFHSGFREFDRRERREHKEDSNSESLSSLRSLRLFHSGFRGFDRRERRDRKEDLDWSIWPQAAAEFPGWEFWHRLCQNRLLASEHFCNSLLQYSHIV